MMLLTHPHPPASEPLIDLFLPIWPRREVHGQMVWYCGCVHVPVDEASQDRRSHRLYGAAVQRLEPDHQHDPDQPQVQHTVTSQHLKTEPVWQASCVSSADTAAVSPSVENISWAKPPEDFITTAPVSSVPQLSSTERPGVISLLLCVFAHLEWNADVDIYVLHTNYDEYALVVMYKQKPGGEKTTSVKLYGKTSVFFLDNI